MTNNQIDTILAEREKTHGDFDKGAVTFCKLMNAGNTDNLTQTQFYALTMINAKITRILNGNSDEIDHWRDIVGYATLAMNAISKDEEE